MCPMRSLTLLFPLGDSPLNYYFFFSSSTFSFYSLQAYSITFFIRSLLPLNDIALAITAAGGSSLLNVYIHVYVYHYKDKEKPMKKRSDKTALLFRIIKASLFLRLPLLINVLQN